MTARKEADGVADVFISYHEQSAGDIAAKIAAALEEAGISCWYAKRDIPAGGRFCPLHTAPTDAPRTSPLVTVVYSPDALQQRR